MRTALVYITAALVLWFTLQLFNHIERYEQLQKTGVHVVGKVVSTTCNNHGSFTYEYIAQGQLLSATGASSVGGLKCQTLAPGMSVPVMYLA